MNYLKKIRATWITLLAVLVIYLLWQTVTPFGTISYQTDFLNYDYFISELSPKERLQGEKGTEKRTITSEPVYFYLRTPRSFQNVKATISVNNPSPLMELGLCRDKEHWQFERQPLYVESLEKLATSNSTITENGIMLWQKNKTYSSITDFLSSLPSVEKIATYNYSLKAPFRIQDYKSISESREISLGAKGGYTIVTYSDGNPIEANFEIKFEKEKDKPTTTLAIVLYNEAGREVMTKEISEAELITSSTIYFKTNKLEAGPYRIEVKASNEVITEKIITTQAQISFANQLWLTEKGRKDFSLITDGSYIKAQTLNPKSLQTIQIENNSLNLPETYQQFAVVLHDQSRSSKEIQIKSDDVMIATDGMLAFREEDIVNPTTRSYSPTLALESAGVEYIIANYQPIGISSTITRELTFPMTHTCLDKGRYPFLIATPGIEANQGTEIKEVIIKLEGKTLFEFTHDLWKKITT